MVNTEETKRIKARDLRYKKPIANGLNLDEIRNSLWDISEACTDVQYYIDCDHDKRMNDHLFPIFIKSIFLRV